MNFQEYKMSKKFDEMLLMCVKKKKLSLSWIQKKWKLSFTLAMILYEEAKNYNDEAFIYDMIHDLKYMEEVPTIGRIMSEYNLSYCFAKRIYTIYIEEY